MTVVHSYLLVFVTLLCLVVLQGSVKYRGVSRCWTVKRTEMAYTLAGKGDWKIHDYI